MKQSLSRGVLLKQLALILVSILIIDVQSVKLNENKRSYDQTGSSRRVSAWEKGTLWNMIDKKVVRWAGS